MPATRTQRMALAYSSRRSFTSSFANLSSLASTSTSEPSPAAGRAPTRTPGWRRARALSLRPAREAQGHFREFVVIGLDFAERAVAGRGTHLNADLGIVKDSVFTSADGSEGHTGFFDLEDLQIRAGRLVALDDVQGLLRHGSRFARRRVVFAFCH